jgi:hypothetical protein
MLNGQQIGNFGGPKGAKKSPSNKGASQVSCSPGTCRGQLHCHGAPTRCQWAPPAVKRLGKLTIAFEGQVTKVIREDFVTRKR